jgi:hypothetical protein
MPASSLKRSYYRQLLPALGAIVLVAAGQAAGLLDAVAFDVRVLGVVIFVSAIAFAAALPVFIRATFAHRVRLENRIEETAFMDFQKRLMRTALLSPYMVPLGLLLGLPGFYQIGIYLAAFYAVYYHYPSERRIGFDRRIFRVQ